MFEEVKTFYDKDFIIPTLTSEEWLEALVDCKTTLQFMRKYLPKLLLFDEKIEKAIQTKYSDLLNSEHLTEGKTVKRMLVGYYDKMIDAGLQSITNSNNKINEDLLNFYMSTEPITEEDITRYSIIDQELFLNKFVYMKMDINMLAQLVYERYTQYKPINKSQKIIERTSDEKVDSEVNQMVQETLQR